MLFSVTETKKAFKPLIGDGEHVILWENIETEQVKLRFGFRLELLGQNVDTIQGGRTSMTHVDQVHFDGVATSLAHDTTPQQRFLTQHDADEFAVSRSGKVDAG